MGAKKNGMKKWLKVFLIVLAVFAAILAGGFLFLLRGLDLARVQIKDIDIAKVKNGTYTGELGGSRFANKLAVTVKDGKVVDVQVLKDMTIAMPELPTQVFDKVKARQSLQIDTVAGATVSTKAYLKALEMALDGK